MKAKPIAYITPCNFGHKAGDGTISRRHNLSTIHPAMQANCGATQCTYVLCLYKKDEDLNDGK